MAEANWYWAEGDEHKGPVAPSVIARLVADGKLGADDVIWKTGMTEWIMVSKVPALVKYLKVTQPAAAPADRPAPVEVTEAPEEEDPAVGAVDETPLPVATEDDINQIVAVTTEQVGYYNPAAGLPPRAAATLQKHARPQGDVGDWPLDDEQVAQFDQSLKLRKRIDGAASLFRVLFLLMIIADVGIIVAAVFLVVAPHGPSRGAYSLGTSVTAVFCVGLSVLYYFAWKGTVRSQLWAPLTMGTLFSIGGLVNLVQFVLPGSSSARAPEMVGATISLVITAAFAYVAFSGMAAIPKYLRKPAWCLELLSKTSA